MQGAKSLTNYEVEIILNELKNERNRCLFILGLKTGFRISELLSLTVNDCFQYENVRDSVTVRRSNMKGQKNSRTVVLHESAKESLLALVSTFESDFSVDTKLFPFGRVQAYRIIKKAVKRAKVTGKVSTHSMRKTFARKVYNALDKDLVATQKAIGHKSMNSTVHYLSTDQERIDKAILEK